MNNLQLQDLEQEKTVFRWGGLSGIWGSVIFLLVFMIVAIFVGDTPTNLTAWIERFPGVRIARTVENTGYIFVLILWIPHFLAMQVALKRTRLAPALFGSVLSVVGLTILAAGALPHVATLPLSDIYQSVEATATDQAVLPLMWQATWAIFDALLFAGLLVVSVGVTFLGIAMLGTPEFGKGYGWFSVLVGMLGIFAGVVLLADPGSLIAVVNVLSLILFHFVIGWKVYSLRKNPFV